MAKKDWKKALEDALDVFGDRFRDFVDALDDLLSPPPEPIPVPIPVSPEGRPRR